jgi:hypothetical protein
MPGNDKIAKITTVSPPVLDLIVTLLNTTDWFPTRIDSAPVHAVAGFDCFDALKEASSFSPMF